MLSPEFSDLQAGADSQAPMLQLPYMTMDVIKRLTRKKIRGLSDLLLLPADERIVTLTASGIAAYSLNRKFQKLDQMQGQGS